MAEYLHPGVYVEERSSGVKPIEGVGTSTAGFVGATARGVPNRATFITSYRAFVSKFGDVSRDGPLLPYAVEQFFANGGKKCYVVRALNDASATGASVRLPARETAAGAARSALKISARGSGAWGNALAVRVEEGSGLPGRSFRLVVLMDGVPVEVFDDLSMDPQSASFVQQVVADGSELITARSLSPASTSPTGAPARATLVTNAVVGPAALNFPANATMTLEVPDGRTIPPLNLTALGAVLPQALADAIDQAFGSFGVAAVITDAADPAGAGRLRLSATQAGFDRYFRVTLANAAPLAGLAGFAQGVGAALGATLKSAAAATFNIVVNDDDLSFTVGGTVLPTITLVAGNRTVESLVDELRAAFAATAFGGRLQAQLEGQRVVVSTTNLGDSSDTRLIVAGDAVAALNLRTLDGTAPPGGGIVGFGRNEPALLISAPGPFVLSANASHEFLLDGAANGAGVTVSYALGAIITNLQNVSAEQVRDTINAAAGGAFVATVEFGRVAVRHARRGPLHTLRVRDVAGAPNLRFSFSGETQRGTADGDAAAPALRPAARNVSGVNSAYALLGGSDGNPVTSFDLIGVADRKTGLHAFDDITDVNFIAIPGVSEAAVVGAAAGYCDLRGDCFFIADAPGPRAAGDPVVEPVQVREHMANQVSPKNGAAALYYPWLQIADRAGVGRNPRRWMPPSGFLAGLYARTDALRGVWKAPAGTEATLIGPVGLSYSVTDAEQDILNPVGVNCIRSFPATGMVCWGARTFATQSDPERRYVPVRRYTVYLKQSIYRGTQWAVFEPNDTPLWSALKANIDDFMMGEFRKGALAGVKPNDAFRVKCDAELNPQSEVNAGRVNMEVLFAPLIPAEFVVIRISQKLQRPQG